MGTGTTTHWGRLGTATTVTSLPPPSNDHVKGYKIYENTNKQLFAGNNGTFCILNLNICSTYLATVKIQMSTSTSDTKSFPDTIRRVREQMMDLGENICSFLRDDNIEILFVPGGQEIWYGDAPYYVKLIAGAPGSLAWNIIHLEADLPRYNCDLEIVGNDVREVERKPKPVFNDDEDCNEELSKLPLIVFDPEKHFTKIPTLKQEIRYLLQCRGSPHIVQLLGRSGNGMLVFPKFETTLLFAAGLLSETAKSDKALIEGIKRWMLEIIDGVGYLHSLGIIHRDLYANNILYSKSSPLVICDLECFYSSNFSRPPDLDDGDVSKFSSASDVFAIGALLWQSCFFNFPKNRYVMLANPPPPPFCDIFLAYTNGKAEERPTLAQLKDMVEAIE